jgi:hypothetical protein
MMCISLSKTLNPPFATAMLPLQDSLFQIEPLRIWTVNGCRRRFVAGLQFDIRDKSNP